MTHTIGKRRRRRKKKDFSIRWTNYKSEPTCMRIYFQNFLLAWLKVGTFYSINPQNEQWPRTHSQWTMATNKMPNPIIVSLPTLLFVGHDHLCLEGHHWSWLTKTTIMLTTHTRSWHWLYSVTNTMAHSLCVCSVRRSLIQYCCTNSVWVGANFTWKTDFATSKRTL